MAGAGAGACGATYFIQSETLSSGEENINRIIFLSKILTIDIL